MHMTYAYAFVLGEVKTSGGSFDTDASCRRQELAAIARPPPRSHEPAADSAPMPVPELPALPPWCEVARLPALHLSEGLEENWQCGLASSLLQCSSAPAAPPSLLLGCSETELEGLLCAYPPLLRRLKSLRGEVDAWAAERTEPRRDLLTALQAARRFSAPDSSRRGFCVLPGFLGRATPCLAGTGLGCHLVSGPQHVVHTVAAGREEGEKPSRCFGALPNDELMLRHGVAVAGNRRETVRTEGMRAALRASGVLSAHELERCRQLDLAAQRGGGSVDGDGGDGGDGINDGGDGDDDSALFLSCAAEHGPCWPGIPGPDVCDLATMVCIRAIVAQGGGGTGRWPLQPAASELRAWECLAALLRHELRTRFAPGPVGSRTLPRGSEDEDEQRDFCLVFREEKRRVLERSLDRLELCIEASQRALAAAAMPDAAGVVAQTPPALVLDADAGDSRGGTDDDASTFTAHAAAMPPLTRRLIAENAEPASVDPYALLRELRLPEPAFRAADAGLRLPVDAAVRRCRGALTPAGCRALRCAVDDNRRRTRRRDTIDGGPDHQLNLSAIELEELVGGAAVRSLLQMAAKAEATIPVALPSADNGGGGGGSGGGGGGGGAPAACPQFFVRRYSSGTRPWIPFHCDTVSVTLNVALNDDCEFCGGRLLALCGGEVRAIHRAEGEATVHRSALLHAVTRMQAGGSRYSLVVFVHAAG